MRGEGGGRWLYTKQPATPCSSRFERLLQVLAHIMGEEGLNVLAHMMGEEGVKCAGPHDGGGGG